MCYFFPYIAILTEFCIKFYYYFSNLSNVFLKGSSLLKPLFFLLTSFYLNIGDCCIFWRGRLA